MSSSRSNRHLSRSVDTFGLPGYSSLWVSLATGPFLLGILGSRAFSEMMQQIGLASEELFRGDRLPVLKLSPPQPDAVQSDEIDSFES